jgi:hypothetical protein
MRIPTVKPDGSPHSMPLWFWSSGAAVYFITSRPTQKARNLRRQPRVVLRFGDGDEVLIVEGRADVVPIRTASRTSGAVGRPTRYRREGKERPWHLLAYDHRARSNHRDIVEAMGWSEAEALRDLAALLQEWQVEAYGRRGVDWRSRPKRSDSLTVVPCGGTLLRTQSGSHAAYATPEQPFPRRRRHPPAARRGRRIR